MPNSPSDEVDEAQMAVVCALKEAISSLKEYPEALKAYFIAEKKALAEYRDIPGMLSSLLITLRAQRTLIETLKIDKGSYSSFVEAEQVAMDAATTVIRIVKVNDEELDRFLTAQRDFYSDYKVFLENPLDNVHALHHFISAEIRVLENKELIDKAINRAHKAVINAMKSSLAALEVHPEALSAFLLAEKSSLDAKTEAGMTKSLLDTHILLLKAQKAILETYKSNKEAYKVFSDAERIALQSKQKVSAIINKPQAEALFRQKLQSFETRYYEILDNPTCNLTDLQRFLDAEIRSLQETRVTEPIEEHTE